MIAPTSSTSRAPRRSYMHAFLSRAVLLCLNVGLSVGAAKAADFLKPTAEELSMTSLPGYPGAPALVLYREELTKDDLHWVQHYERLKILTEEGKKYANVELGYVSSTSGFYQTGDDKVLEDVSGRTIHPDGTVIPFTGKPYLKVLEKGNGYKLQQKVFTLPDVEVGSIIEYRYSTHINDNIFESPIWMIQDDLFVKEAHFAWWPTSKQLVDEDEKLINSISWFPILPEGAKIEMHETPGGALSSATRVYEIHVKDIPPRIKEEYMPPIASFSYRVNFSFTPYRSQQDYWQNVGKQWSKRVNNFAGPSNALREITQKVTAGANTPDEKLHKIYAAVMGEENTAFTRERDEREDKAAGIGQIKDAADVFRHERGTPKQLTELFVGMARAAGLNASVMWVPDRAEEFFVPYWLSTRQLDDYVAVVNVDGKDIFFDPGSRYCAYGQLAWQHTMVYGLRQADSGTTIVPTPADSYKNNHITRVANLTMDAHGEVTGKIDLGYTGSPAVRWRQLALRGDDEGLRKELRENAEAMLPKTLEIEVFEVNNLKDYDQPLSVSYTVKGTLGTTMGKRTAVPADVFLANNSATFPHEKRELAVYFQYPHRTQDAVRINFPKELAIEAAPTSAKYDLTTMGAYALQVTQAPTSITTRREVVLGTVLIMPKDYAALRTYYSQFESKDQELVLLKASAPPVEASTSHSAKH